MSKNLNITRAEAQTRAGYIKNPSYTVALTIDGLGDTYSCVASINFEAQNGTQTWLDLISPQVDSVWLNGSELKVSEVFDGTRIKLTNLKDKNTVQVKANCSYMNTGEGLHRHIDPVDSEVYIYTQFEVADSRRVFPVFEQPDIKGTLALTVTAPSKWTLISNSPTPASVKVNEEMSTWSFAVTPTMSSYLYALCAGPYFKKTDVYKGKFGTYPLAVFVRPSLSEFLDHEEIPMFF